MAPNPSATFTIVITSCWPKAKARIVLRDGRAAEGEDEHRLLRAGAAGREGKHRREPLDDEHRHRRLHGRVDVEGAQEEERRPDPCHPARRLPGHDLRAGTSRQSPRIANPRATFSLNAVTCRLAHATRRIAPPRRMLPTNAETCGMLDDERPVERAEGGQIGRSRKQPRLEGPEEEHRREDEVEEGLDHERRGQRRVGGLLHCPVLGEVELHHVAAACGHDGVHAHARRSTRRASGQNRMCAPG